MDNDDDWEAAEAALKKARSLPSGSKRIEALRQAGKLRFAADRPRNKKARGRPSRYVFSGADELHHRRPSE